MAVVGPKEVETQIVTVRSRFGGELGTMIVFFGFKGMETKDYPKRQTKNKMNNKKNLSAEVWQTLSLK